MTDLAKLDIAIDDVTEFLKLAWDLRKRLFENEVLMDLDKQPLYPIDEAAKVRASSLRVYHAMIDLRRKEGKRL